MASSDSDDHKRKRRRHSRSRSRSRSHRSKGSSRDRSKSRERHRRYRDSRRRRKSRERSRRSSSSSPDDRRKSKKTGSTVKSMEATKKKMREALAKAGQSDGGNLEAPMEVNSAIVEVADRHREIEKIESSSEFKPATFMSFRSGKGAIRDEEVTDQNEKQSQHEDAIFGKMSGTSDVKIEAPLSSNSNTEKKITSESRFSLAHENLLPSEQREQKWLNRWRAMRQKLIAGKPIQDIASN